MASYLYPTGRALEPPVTEVPPPRQEYNVQRRGARTRLRKPIPARLHFWEVTLLDISRSGVLLAHSDRVRVGGVYQLRFPVEGRGLTVQAQVVRSFVNHFVPVRGGEQQIIYHTGMEFTTLTNERAELIADYLHSLRAADLAP